MEKKPYRRRKSLNVIEVCGASAKIHLSCGNVCLVSTVDVPLVSSHYWFSSAGGSGNRYIHANIAGKRVKMHRILLGAPSHLEVDHRNGDRFDNRRQNLRLATRLQNARNHKKSCRADTTSTFNGVSFHPKKNKWQARFRIEGKQRHIGYFSNEIVAAMEWDRVALEQWGEFARLNFPEVR